MKFSKEKYLGLGYVPIGIVAVIKGWNVTEEHFKNINALPVIDFFAITHTYPNDKLIIMIKYPSFSSIL